MNTKLFIIIIIIIIAIIEEISSHTLFPGVKSFQEQTCLNVTSPSKVDDCTSIKAENEQDACCFVTYKNESSGEDIFRCGFLENTEYGIRLYKRMYAGYKNVKIMCESRYGKNFILFISLLFFLII